MMKSRISALVDGELEQKEAMALLAAAKGHERESLRQDWLTYHLIRDTLRQNSPLSADFDARFSERLAQEPTILAPSRSSAPAPRRTLIALSAAASVTAFSVVGWVAFQINGGNGAGPAAATVVAEAGPPALNVSSYLIAHQEYSHAAQDTVRYQRASLEKTQDRGQ
ncbi:MAG: sigma-E factor negative regulatory protein [Sulfuricella sp.]|nr:sigma-E factor negative regulatory protein [Sulfuricella sp.]